MALKKHIVVLDSGEAAHASYCIGVAMRQFMLEHFKQGKPITDTFIAELTRLQEKLERVH